MSTFILLTDKDGSVLVNASRIQLAYRDPETDEHYNNETKQWETTTVIGTSIEFVDGLDDAEPFTVEEDPGEIYRKLAKGVEVD